MGWDGWWEDTKRQYHPEGARKEPLTQNNSRQPCELGKGVGLGKGYCAPARRCVRDVFCVPRFFHVSGWGSGGDQGSWLLLFSYVVCMLFFLLCGAVAAVPQGRTLAPLAWCGVADGVEVGICSSHGWEWGGDLTDEGHTGTDGDRGRARAKEGLRYCGSLPPARLQCASTYERPGRLPAWFWLAGGSLATAVLVRKFSLDVAPASGGELRPFLVR